MKRTKVRAVAKESQASVALERKGAALRGSVTLSGTSQSGCKMTGIMITKALPLVALGVRSRAVLLKRVAPRPIVGGAGIMRV